MSDAFCISCGRRINAARAIELGYQSPSEESTEETFTVTFYYMRRFTSEYDTCCQITIDSHLSGVSSIDEPLSVKLTGGNHSAVIKVLAHIGVKSTDVMSTVNIFVDKDKSYYVKAHGSSFNRKIIISDTKE